MLSKPPILTPLKRNIGLILETQMNTIYNSPKANSPNPTGRQNGTFFLTINI